MNSPKNYTLVCAILLMLAGFGVYASSIPNDFVWDDKNLIVNNPDIKELSLKNVKTIFTHDLVYFIDRSNFYRPLQSLSYMLDYTLRGPDPRLFRAVNIAVHSLNGVIIFLLLLLLLRNVAASFFAALFFVVHPLNTSAVTYIAGRADLLALFFMLASCLFMFRFKETQSVFDGGLSVLLAALSFLAKEVCIVFPAAALLIYIRARGDDARRFNAKENAFFYSLFLIAIVYLALRLTVLKFAPLGSQAINAPGLDRRLFMLPPVILTYLRLAVLPYDLRMDRDITIPSSLFDPEVIFSLIALAALIAIVIRYAKGKEVASGIGWFFILLFPSLNIIVPLNAPLSEHWLYLPFFGVSIVLAYGIKKALDKFGSYKKAILVVLVFVMAAYGSVTVYVNRCWKNEKTLFVHISKYERVNPRSHYNLGCRYIEEKKYAEAVAEFKRTLKRDPEYFEAIVSMTVALVHLNDFDSAQTCFAKAMALKPGSSPAYAVYAQALDDAGRHDDAIRLYSKAIEFDGANVAAHNGLGVAYAKKEMYDEAKKAWEKGLAVEPGSAEIRQNLTRLSRIMAARPIEAYIANTNKFASEGRYDLAIEESKKALEIDPKNISVHNNLGVLYSLNGDDEAAAAEFKKVLFLNPKEAGTYKNIAIIYSKYPEKYPEAIEYFRKYMEMCSSDEERALVEKKIEELKRGAGRP